MTQLRAVDAKPLPKASIPGLATLQARFPHAGIPDRIFGQNLDYSVMYNPHVSPEAVMGQLKGMHINTVRMGAYWIYIQPNGPDTQPDFKRLDAWLTAAEHQGIKVILSLGAKTPLYPEVNIPPWAWQLAQARHPSDNPKFVQADERFIELVLQHVKATHLAQLIGVQIENEPFNPSGPLLQSISLAQVKAEVDLARTTLDHRVPIFLNSWCSLPDIPMILAALQLADAAGIDVYMNSPQAAGSELRTHDVPLYVLHMAASLGKPVVVMEGQADGWPNISGVNMFDPIEGTPPLVHRLEALGYMNIVLWRMSYNLKLDAQGNHKLDDEERSLAVEDLGTGR
jgi:hypothetical protein